MKKTKSEPQNTASRPSRYAFIAEHRGGPLTKEQHRLLINWACVCVEHVIQTLGEKIDKRLYHALNVAKLWEKEQAPVGDARNAAFKAIAVANEQTDPTEIAIARSVGHVVATAHMADHAIRAAEYAIKALAYTDKSIDVEREWQDAQLSPKIKELVLTSRTRN